MLPVWMPDRLFDYFPVPSAMSCLLWKCHGPGCGRTCVLPFHWRDGGIRRATPFLSELKYEKIRQRSRSWRPCKAGGLHHLDCSSHVINFLHPCDWEGFRSSPNPVLHTGSARGSAKSAPAAAHRCQISFGSFNVCRHGPAVPSPLMKWDI